MRDYRFASSPWGFRFTPLVDHCQWLQDHGVKHICNFFSAELKGATDPAISDDGITKLARQIKSFGLEHASFNADGDFMVLKGTDDQIAMCCKLIDKAAKFKPQVIIVFAGWQPREDDAVYGQVSSALKQVARHAAKYNLTVALENHGGLTRTAEQINRILAHVKEPNIGVNYDPANFLMYGEDPYDALQELKHPIVYTHFKSVKKVKRKKVYCRLSEGMIDYLPILKFLDKKYSGFYAIEYEEPADVFTGSEEDLATLKDWLVKIQK